MNPDQFPDKTFKLPASFVAQIEEVNKRLSEGISQMFDSMKSGLSIDVGEWATDTMHKAQPSNWPEDAYQSYATIKEILQTDGIPIVHVPRAEIVASLLKAQSFDDRIQLIEDRADDIAEDCRAALSGTFHREIEKQGPLALEAVETYQAGRYAPAQALAVAVCDTYLKTYIGGRYKAMIEEVKLEKADDLPARFGFNFNYAFAPVVSFLTEWFPDSGTPAPTKLSRHVSVHNASTDHMTKLNATIAIMLAASLTVAIDLAERGGHFESDSSDS